MNKTIKDKLQQNKRDMILLEFLLSHNIDKTLAHNNKLYNRGDLFEMALTRELVKRDGLHAISQGDRTYNGVSVEIKYLTKQTGASDQEQGTTCNYYLIGFNDGDKITIKLINKKDLKTRFEKTRRKITYQDNINLGVEIKGL